MGVRELSNMKTDKKNVEQYIAPEMTQIDIMPEGVLCASGGVDNGEGEGGSDGGTFPF